MSTKVELSHNRVYLWGDRLSASSPGFQAVGRGRRPFIRR